MKLLRVYHPVSEWEEMRFNMWGPSSASLFDKAVEITGDHVLYGSWMHKVITDWPVSCENALTDYSINRKAWLGHAAMAYGYQIPESTVRAAWGKLTHEQRQLANSQAAHWIEVWENGYRLRNPVSGGLGKQVLLQWDS